MFYVHNEFWMSGLQPYNTVARIDEVRVDRLNEVLKELQPTVIVCDVEGEEKDLFNDADLNSVARILIEIHQYRIGDSGVVNLFNALHARDFCYDQYRSEKAVVCFYRTVS